MVRDWFSLDCLTHDPTSWVKFAENRKTSSGGISNGASFAAIDADRGTANKCQVTHSHRFRIPRLNPPKLPCRRRTVDLVKPAKERRNYWPMIEFDQASRNYGPKTAVDRLTLTIQPGELFAPFGSQRRGQDYHHQNAGRLVAAHRRHRANLRLRRGPRNPPGESLHRLRARRAVSCTRNYPVANFCSSSPICTVLGREESATRIAREIRNFSLAEFVDQMTESYSHGMKQRLVFAAALLHDPAVLVLDEPMVGLDPRSMRLVKDMLRERANAGMAIFMSTHTLGLAEEIADRIGIVDRGRLRFLGTVDRLRQQLARRAHQFGTHVFGINRHGRRSRGPRFDSSTSHSRAPRSCPAILLTISSHRSAACFPSSAKGRCFGNCVLNNAAATLRWMLNRARLRMSLVGSLSLFFWVGLFVLFYQGFGYLTVRCTADVVQPLYNAFFLALMVMLMFSSGIILYNSLYCSPEASFLLTTPARAQRIYQHKFQEAVWFSSWGFILLGSPTLVAYGVAVQAPWYYFALLLPFVVAFVYIPAAIGGIFCLLIVHRMPSIRLHALAVALLAVVSAIVWFVWMTFRGAESDLMTPQLVSRYVRPVAVHRAAIAPQLVVEHRAAGSFAPSHADSFRRSSLGTEFDVLGFAGIQRNVF